MAALPKKSTTWKKWGRTFPINYKEVNYAQAIEQSLWKKENGPDFLHTVVAGKSFKKHDLKLLAHGGRMFCFGGAGQKMWRSGPILINRSWFFIENRLISPPFP